MSSRLIQKIRDLHRFGTAGKLLTIGVLVMAVLALTTHSAHAQSLFGIANAWDFLMKILASFMNVVLSVSSWFVALTGTLLNVSINLTMHIRDFVNSTPAIYDVWKAIRDISGMFIIFGLMYASIRMILGKDAKLGQTIKNIVVAGVLINFSFFITGLCIDASNIVSLQLYNAITPGQPDIGKLINSRDAASVGTLPQIVNTLFSDGGLSAVFMQSLQLQTTFNSKNLGMSDPSAGISTPFRIILIGTTGVVIMITAGLSFLFASLAFVIRLVLLLILLAFSPIWFAAAIIPQLKEYADEWWKVFKNQLIFMPAYLLFMYVALRIISNSNLFNTGAYGSLWKGAQTNALVPTEFISFAINAALIIVMLNIPLLAAIKLGAVTGGLLDGKKMGADILWKKVGSFTGRNTLGAGANKLNDSATMRRIYANNPNLGLAISKRLSKVSGSGFGEKNGSYDGTLKQRKKDIEALHKQVGTDSDKERGKRYQNNMVQNLGKSSVFTLMMKDRANLEVAKKYKDKAQKDKDLEDLKAVVDVSKFRERQLDADINVSLNSIRLIKEQSQKTAEQLQKQKDDQVNTIDEQIRELREKSGRYTAIAGPGYAQEIEDQIKQLTATKTTISSVPLATAQADADIDRLEKHVADLRKRRAQNEDNRRTTEEQIRKKNKEKEKEEDREKLVGGIKDSVGGGGGGEKKEDKK